MRVRSLCLRQRLVFASLWLWAGALSFAGCVAQEPYDAQVAPAGGSSGSAGSLNVDPSEAGASESPGGAGPIDEPGVGCTASSQCGAPFPYCATDIGRCVQCMSNPNCAGGSSHRYCDPKSFACVACLTDQQCSSLAPYCASAIGTCVQCLTSANCGDPGLACDRINFRCVPSCETNADCAAAFETPFCDPSRSLCVACASDQDCTGLTPRCDTQAGSCVECVEDADCPKAAARCDTRKSACVQCLTSRDCSSGATCVGGTCVNPK